MADYRIITAEEAELLGPFAEGLPLLPMDETRLQIARIEREAEAQGMGPHDSTALARLYRLAASQAGEEALRQPGGPKREALLSMRGNFQKLARTYDASSSQNGAD